MKKRNLFKLAALTAVFALGSMFANAQQTTGNITKQTNADPGTVNKSVKVIDNKGTVKYIQSNNGITTFTNTNISDGGVVTTFQLGGTLLDSTYIDVNDMEFGLVGLDSVNAGVGYELIVTDPISGELKRMAFDGLITAGRVIFPMPADVTTLNATQDVPVPGIPLAYEKVYVYRNGAKLLASTDYTISAGKVILHVTADLPVLYTGDKIEVHYVK